MSSFTSYPSVFVLGHKAIKDLLTGEVNIEEKCDGSQFSFGLVEGSEADALFEGTGLALKIRSKGCVMHIDAPEKMFQAAAVTVRRLAGEGLLWPNYTYRGEFLAKPHHNALTYDRVPAGNIILFDVSTEDGGFLSYEDKVEEAQRLGLEVVPLLFTGIIKEAGEVRRFLETTSILGGQKIEGVVLKPVRYDLYGQDKKVLMGKFVSEAYKEVHRKSWGESNPSNKDIIQRIVGDYTTPARWNKSIQHLREKGLLLDDVRDIGPVIKEVPLDVLAECKDEIMERLFCYAWPHIRRGLTAGFPQYYKELLLKRAFEIELPEVSPIVEATNPVVIHNPEQPDEVGDDANNHEYPELI